jgi:hypothetical protein
LYNENVMLRAPPSGSEPVAIIIAVEELWLNDFDFDFVVAQSTVVSGACMVVVDGVFGVELRGTDAGRRSAVVAFCGSTRCPDALATAAAAVGSDVPV